MSKKEKDIKFVIAIVLFIASIATAALISILSHRGESVWIATVDVPQGAPLTHENIEVITVQLGSASTGYLSAALDPIGSISARRITAGEILREEVIAAPDAINRSVQISLPVRSSDIPATTGPGDIVTIFQVHDVRNGESEYPPLLVLESAFISQIDRKGSNFGNDLIVTVSISESDAPVLLQSTTSGRIVLIATHG